MANTENFCISRPRNFVLRDAQHGKAGLHKKGVNPSKHTKANRARTKVRLRSGEAL